VRRAVVGLAVTVVAAAVVVGLGQVAEMVAAVRAVESGGPAGTPAGSVVPAPLDRSNAWPGAMPIAQRVEGGTVTITVAAERTVWEVARAVAPGASGSELAALVERIVTDNSLGSVRLHPGQVLRVTVG
jgi:hypothetical protein